MKRFLIVLMAVLILAGLYLSGMSNYILFHNLAEIFSVVIAWSIFTIAWNSRHFLTTYYLLFIGIAYLFVGGLDLFHTLANQEPSIFRGNDGNVATQLWIAARYMQSLSLLLASLMIRKKPRVEFILSGYGIVTLLLLLAIFEWRVFPTCYIEGIGLTQFKKTSEVVTSLLLLASIVSLVKQRDTFDRGVLVLLVWSTIFTIGSELSFTLYTRVHDFSNLLGHLLKIVSFYLIYRAIIQTGISKPYELLFRELKSSEEKYRSLFTHMINAFAHHKVVFDEAGKPADYVFLDVNDAFEKYAGLKKTDLIGKSVTEAVPGIRSDKTDWIARYGKVAASGDSIRFESYSDSLKRWYSVLAYSPQPGYFVTLFEDITERKRMEDALKESETRYRRLFEEASVGIRLTDAETGEMLDCNRAFWELRGYEHSELIGEAYEELITKGEDWTSLSETTIKHLSKGQGAVRRTEVVTRSGEVRQVEVKSSILEIGDRRIFQSFFRDITEESRYHNERETTLKLLHLLSDHGTTHELIDRLVTFLRDWSGCGAVGIRLREGDDFPYFEARGFPPEFIKAESSLCTRSPSGQIIKDSLGNPVLECMCGNVLCGRFDASLPFFTPKGSFWTNSTSKLLATTSESDRQARTRNRCNGEGYESVALIPLRVGTEMLGLLQINDRSRNCFTPERISFLERVADQIAMALAQRRAQAALSQSERRFREMLEGIRLIAVMLNERGEILFCNPYLLELTGWERDEILGSDWFETFIPSYVRDEGRSALRRGIHSEDLAVHYENVIVTRQGVLLEISWTNTFMRDAQGEIIGVTSLGENMTERKRLEAQLRQSQKLEAIGTLAGGIAHDFNNILAPIIGYTEMALTDTPPWSPMRQDLEQVLKASHRARDLVKQILAFSRHGKEHNMEPIDISTIIKEALKLMRASLPSSIQITQTIQEGIAQANATQIHQVLVNLCTNAAHAMNDRGELHVALTAEELDNSDLDALSTLGLKPGRYLKLRVSDTGHGMDASIVERIFDPYFTTKEVGKGSGLGLAVVHGIVKQHKGAISVRSEPGKGSTFDVYIPRAEKMRELAEEVSFVVPQGTERVLLVDDELMLADMTAILLERLGYRVRRLTSAVEALQVFRSNPLDFDLVITDYTMPQMTGIELSGEILKIRPGMRIILCTGYSEKVTEQSARAHGIAGFALKPVDRRQLAELVRSTLDAGRL